jgi:hypothetical protein
MKDLPTEIVAGIGEGADLTLVLCDSRRKGLLRLAIDELAEVKCSGSCSALALGVVFRLYLLFVVSDLLCFRIQDLAVHAGPASVVLLDGALLLFLQRQVEDLL